MLLIVWLMVLELPAFIFKACLHVIFTVILPISIVALAEAAVLLIGWSIVEWTLVKKRLLLELLLLLLWLIVLLEMRGQSYWPVLVLGNAFILTVLVSYLSSGFASSKLTLRLKPVVPVNSDCATVNCRTVERVHSKPCFFSGCIFDEAESTGLHFDFVETHDQIDDLATLRKHLKQLRLECEKR